MKALFVVCIPAGVSSLKRLVVPIEDNAYFHVRVVPVVIPILAMCGACSCTVQLSPLRIEVPGW